MKMIDAKTKLFCVIGDPIEHSMSPVMHNTAFEHMNLNCAYTAFRVRKEGLEDAIRGMKALGITGANVTIPHKVEVMKHLDELSEEARIIGAVNTIKIGEKLEGYNTDGMGALRALRSGGADPKGKSVLMIGSGGAARAIAVTLGLKGGPSSITILGVEKDELNKLAGDVSKGTEVRAEGRIMTDETLREELEKADLLIHCTPVGMHPKVDNTLVTADLFHEDLKVMDIVYNPLETRLLREAKKAGVKTTISGIDMFVNQGAESLRIWLGIDPPVEVMKRVVASELSKG
ncbi:MAG: shikimate dehydrogenase [Candidatus Hydrothermarchaeales archaeon]